MILNILHQLLKNDWSYIYASIVKNIIKAKFKEAHIIAKAIKSLCTKQIRLYY